MQNHRALTLIGALVISAGTLAGCGDDTEAIAKADFVEQANARCQAVQDELDPVFEAMWADFEEADENCVLDAAPGGGGNIEKLELAVSPSGEIFVATEDEIYRDPIP